MSRRGVGSEVWGWCTRLLQSSEGRGPPAKLPVTCQVRRMPVVRNQLAGGPCQCKGHTEKGQGTSSPRGAPEDSRAERTGPGHAPEKRRSAPRVRS